MSAITIVGSTDGGAINGGNVTLTYPTGTTNGDCAIVNVTLGTSKTATLSVTSSSGAGSAWTQIVTSFQSSNVRMGVFRRIITSTAETQCIITGTGGSTDATSGIIHTFRRVDRITPEDVSATSTSGSGTTPDSPSITVATSGCVIVTTIAIGNATATLTPGSGSTNNATSNIASDTNPANNGQAWATNASTSAFNPAAWTASVTGTWLSATVALRREYDLGFAAMVDGDDTLVNEMRRTIVRSY